MSSQVTKLAGTWVVMVTSGYNNINGVAGDGGGFLYVLNALTGELIYKIATGAGGVGTPSGLGQINNYVDNVLIDNTTLRAYGGDMLGNMWRFDFLPASLHASSVLGGGGLMLFDLDIVDAGSADGFTAGHLQLHLRHNLKADTIDIAASADAVKGVRSVKLTQSLNHAERLAPLLRGETSWPKASEVWRDTDGKVSLDTAGPQDAAQVMAVQKLLAALY